jgi:hypothetical protein
MDNQQQPVERKVLAIAVMRDGKVVGKLIPGREPVRMGTGYNNNIVVEGDGLPDSYSLVTPGADRDSWTLRLTDGMNALVTSDDGTKLSFADLKDLGIFPKDETGFYLLHIKYGDQGQILAGHYVIHFGFISPPAKKEPEKPKPAEKAAAPLEPEKEDVRVLKLVHEAPGSRRRDIFPNAGIMTVGEADYNTVCIKGADLPRIHTLLEPEGSKYLLRLIPQIKGGVEVKGSIIPFQTLIERNLMKQEKPGEPYTWMLDKNVSGVFTIGSTEIFFGFVEPTFVPKVEKVVKVEEKKPYVAPTYEWGGFAARPHDAIALKGSGKEKNRLQFAMGIVLGISLVLGSAFDRLVMVHLESRTQMLRRAPTARVASLSQNTPTQTEGFSEEIISESELGEGIGTIGGPGGGGPGGGGEGPAGVAAGAQAGQGVLQSIGFAAYGTQGMGGSAGFVGDLQSAASAGLGLASGQTGEALIAGSGGGGSGGLTGLVPAGGGVASSAETVSQSDIEAVHRAATVSFSASGSGEALDLGLRNMTDIRGRINVIKMRIQAAYESLLRSNPMAGGTVQISFDITPGGGVTNVSVSAPGDLQSLVPTIQSAVAGLNFGSVDGQTSNLTVQVPFNLLPPE